MLQGAGFHPVSVNEGSLHLEARTRIENLVMLQDALCQARWRVNGIVKSGLRRTFKVIRGSPLSTHLCSPRAFLATVTGIYPFPASNQAWVLGSLLVKEPGSSVVGCPGLGVADLVPLWPPPSMLCAPGRAQSAHLSHC